MIRRLAILLLVCGGLGFFLQREQARGTFDALERWWLARVQQVQGPPRPEPPVVLVELRRGDLPFESWPPAPLDFALVFESLVRHQPREVVVQPLLAWPGVEPLDAATLAERIALLPRGVLACALLRDPGGLAGEAVAVMPLATLPGASGDVMQVPAFDTLGQAPIEELRAGKTLGFTRIEFGEGMAAGDGVVAVPLVARRGPELVASLTLQALLSWQQVAPAEVVVQLGRRLALGPGLEVPVDAGGRQLLTTRLAPPLRRLDAGTLLLDLERDAKLMTERPAEMETLRSMKGALVVLGETGENTPRFAVAGAPDGGWTEAEVLARSLVAALSGHHLREPPARWQWAGWGAVVLVGAALLGSPRRWLPVFALGGVAALALGFALAFLNGQWWIAPVPPLALWLAASLVAALLPATLLAGRPATPTPAPVPAAPIVPAPAVTVPVEPVPAEPVPDATILSPAPETSSETATEATMAPETGTQPPQLAETKAAAEAKEAEEMETLTRQWAVDASGNGNGGNGNGKNESEGKNGNGKNEDEGEVPDSGPAVTVPANDVPAPAAEEEAGGPEAKDSAEAAADRAPGPKPWKGGRKGPRSARGRGPG